MAEMGRWNGHVFEVSPKLIRGFTGLTIKGASNTEDKESGGQGYVSRKHGKPMEVSLSVALNAMTGCDVRTEAMKFVEEARAGKKDYFYVGNKKLVTCQLMLTDASVKDVAITNGGKWVRAEVSLTMKQCSKNDGSSASSGGGSSGGGSSGGGSGGSKKSSKKKSVKQESLVSKIKNGIKNTVNKVKSGVKNVVNALTGKKTSSNPLTNAIKSAQSAIKKITTAAKKATTTKKTTPAKKTTKSGGGGGGKAKRTAVKY